MSRLFVAPTARGQHAGSALLAALSAHARDDDLQLMLDVVDDGGAAVALYESPGWRLVDRRSADWVRPDGQRPKLCIHVGPGGAPSSPFR